MLASLYDQAFDDANWVYEIKWDGYRAIAEVNKEEIRLYSRNGLSFEADYPIIFEELKKIQTDVVIDGEIAVLDKDGIPRFQLLQQYAVDPDVSLCYFVFDCLQINGKSIEGKPLLERKEQLKKILPESDIIKYCDHVAERGKDFFEAIKKQGLEGMIAKKADSVYREGNRSSEWLKVKNIVIEEAVIAGYTAARGGRKYFGALVLGNYQNGKLVYIGHTGTGFNDKTLKDVFNQLQPYVTDHSPFDTKVAVNAPVTWVKPQLVCNLKYSEITGEGHRRHPVFLGLRKDKNARDVHPEVEILENIIENKNQRTSLKANKPVIKMEKKHKETPKGDDTQIVDGKEVTLSHLDKVFWPEDGYTKGDVIEYYNHVYGYISKYLQDRPESLLRNPNGITDKGFFHKDAGENAPEWVETITLYSDSAEKDIEYIVCNNKPTLLYMANLGCIEINPWNSRVDNLDNPDYLVMDIDPSDNNTFEQVIETANVIKEILDKAGAVSYPKTSGATGIHVYVPLGAAYTYDQAKDFAHMIATMANEQLPDFTSLERSLSKRGKDHIYIDFLQNRRGQTLSSVYSLRPKPGATVSTPLEWKEVKKGLHPSDFNIKNIIKRIEKKGDIFSGVLAKGIDMKKCIKLLSA